MSLPYYTRDHEDALREKWRFAMAAEGALLAELRHAHDYSSVRDGGYHNLVSRAQGAIQFRQAVERAAEMGQELGKAAQPEELRRHLPTPLISFCTDDCPCRKRVFRRRF